MNGDPVLGGPHSDAKRPEGLAEAFLADLTLEARQRVASITVVRPVLSESVSAAAEAWPALRVDLHAFVRSLARRVATDEDPVVALRSLRTSELYLTFACAAGDPKALRLLEKHYFAGLTRALRSRMRLSALAVADTRRDVLSGLWLPRGDRPAVILEYSGRGRLEAWLATVAVHEAMANARRERRLFDEEAGDDDPPAEPNLAEVREVELSSHRAVFSEELKVVTAEALASLPRHKRRVLRQYVLEGLSMEEISRRSRVHRATVARWVAEVRCSLHERIRDDLRTRLGLTMDEIDALERVRRRDVRAQRSPDPVGLARARQGSQGP